MNSTLLLGVLSLPAVLLANANTGPAVHHVERIIAASAQDRQGDVWAVGAHPEKLLLWGGDDWVEVSDASSWDGSLAQNFKRRIAQGGPINIMGRAQAGVLAMWPSPEGGVESLWESEEPLPGIEPTETSAPLLRASRLYRYRHTKDLPRTPLGEERRTWPHVSNPLAESHRLGDAWKSAPIREVMPQGHTVWLLTTPQYDVGAVGLFAFEQESQPGLRAFPATGLRTLRLYQPRAVAAGDGAIWLWGASHSTRPPAPARPRFFARFFEGNYDLAPAIEGLPAAQEIDTFVASADGAQAVVAVQDHGLWSVDLDARRAVARNSPPLPAQARIWSWQGWDDGLEVVLASEDPTSSNRQSFWAALWMKNADGWSRRGRFRVDTWQGSALRPLPAKPLKWLRWDNHLILTGPRRAHVLSLHDHAAEPVMLDWRKGFRLRNPDAAYLLPRSNELLMVGSTTARLRAGELSSLLAAESSPIIRMDECLRGVDGRLFTIETLGPSVRRLAEWDGTVVRYHPIPSECSHGNIRQDSTGRLWLAGGANDAAWTLLPTDTEPRWQRHERLLDVIADYASLPGEKSLHTLRNETPPAVPPAFHPGGRALAMTGHGEFSLFSKDDGWLALPKLEGRRQTMSLDFSEQGDPRVSFSTTDIHQDEIWIWTPSAGWQAVGMSPSRYARRSEQAKTASAVKPPDWIQEALPRRAAGAAPSQIVADHDGTWWAISNNQLWRAREGSVRLALHPGIGHPWMSGAANLLETVETDERGNRYAWYYDEVVIVPSSALAP